jgi:hypothetical protein
MSGSVKLKSKQERIARMKTQTEGRMTKTKSITVASVLKTISDPLSVELFKYILEVGIDSSDLRSKSRLSRRQYYSRLSNFIRNGMLIKKNGITFRTSLGRIVYHVLMLIENALMNYYKLEAIDSIGLYLDIPQEEHKKIIETLISEPNIKQILFSGNVSGA